jgi:flagellar basal body-associated protein FliL
MRIQKTNNKALSLITLMMIVIGVFLCAGATTAFAAENTAEATTTLAAENTAGTTTSPTTERATEPQPETLSVDEVWLTGDVLHIAVTDMDNGEKQTLNINLSDYAKPGDEYVSVQATDSAGRISNVIQFKNPYFIPVAEDNDIPITEESDKYGESAAPDTIDPPSAGNPFTPDGAGSVVDNASGSDGKEFFTVETAGGSIFYLIVDRQRNAENVYFLNAVTEDDLLPLAKPGDGNPYEPAAPTPSAPPIINPEQSPEPAPAPPVQEPNNNKGTILLIVGAMVLVGGIGYYFKIVRPKKEAAYDDDNAYYEPDDNTELPLDDESEVDEE